MRVLWFTNIPMPAMDARAGRRTGGSGHWMSALLAALRAGRPDLELGVATAYGGLRAEEFGDDGVRYFTIGQPRFFSHNSERPRDLAACREVVARFRPDVVHVHGTERFYGLLAARRLISVPTVISMQGVLSALTGTFFGALSPIEIVRAHRVLEVATRRGLAWSYLDQVRAARREREIVGGASALLGRTSWDRAQATALAPGAPYFHVGELLRPEFRSECWSRERCIPNRVFVTNGGHPRRGVEILLKAASLLAARRPGFQLCIAGGIGERTGYGQFVRRQIAALGLEPVVRLTGYLDGPALVSELLASRVYATASFGENSPNSLCEAMSLGMPCVASYVGGIPDLVEHGRTGLLVPVGDVVMLAQRLEELLSDDRRADQLGEAARREALQRHAPETVVAQLLAAYEHSVREARSSAAEESRL